MGVIVQKYGGTSVGEPAKIKRVATRVVETAQAGNDVCVVVSAMGHTTDELIELAKQISPDPHPREMDMLLTAGERISMALLSMAINDLGREAVSFTGSQAGILTDTTHGKAKIIEIRAIRVQEALAEGKIAIVAGFQGVSTTLERHDARPRRLGPARPRRGAGCRAPNAFEVCEIYTDVRGVFTADPRIAKNARKVDRVTFDEMLELAACGAGVLALRSVEYARTHGVKIHVRSSFLAGRGDLDRQGGGHARTGDHLEGVAHDTSEAKVTIRAVPDQIGVAARTFRALADAGINIDMIVQNHFRRRAIADYLVHAPRKRGNQQSPRPVLDQVANARSTRAGSSATRTSRRSR